MSALTEADLLQVWEEALPRDPTERALTLASAASARTPDSLADVCLGERDALLLELQESCFGSALRCEVDCPACGDRLETALDIAEVRAPVAGSGPARVEVDGTEVWFRPLTSRDLMVIGTRGPDPRKALIGSCVVGAGPDAAALPGPLSESVIDAVGAALGDADPQADIVLNLACSSCGESWDSRFDLASYLWLEVDAYARRLLRDIQTLALSYGWSEADALAVSPVRRRFYVDEAPA